MKRFTQRMIGLLLALVMVAGLIPVLPQTQAQAATPSQPQTQAVTNDQSMQDGVTLHCWNWSYANISAKMAQIAEQGYTAIQVSPIQKAKQPTAGFSANDWWVFYQPADFAIDNSGTSALGTKAQFTAMCNKAHQYGIKVIVDVVANHMGNGNNGSGLSPAIIADLRNDSSCWHNTTGNISNYYDRYDITHYCLDGVPDLNTGNSKVQNYVLNFLKECVDAGADGFRFDAVKHIETPDDAYGTGSNFWPTVINGIKAYDPDVYVYGEFLYHADEGTALADSAYTKYMSVTDNSWSNSVRNNVIGGKSAGNFSHGFHKNADPDKLVVWAESHDNYAGDGSSGMSTADINKTWALVAARADAMALYLARPNSLGSQKLGDASVTGWSYPEVAAVNKFHTHFAGQGEYVSNQNNIAYVERGTSGVILVNCGGTSTSVNVTANTMANGTYTDQITGNKFTVSNGKISGSIGSTGIAVVYNPITCDHESHDTDGICTSCHGKVDHSYVNDTCTVCGKTKPADRKIYFANSSSWSTVNAYTWNDDGTCTGEWPGTAMTSEGEGIYSITVPGEAVNIIFNNGTTQTEDLVIPSDADLFTYSTLSWSAYKICAHNWVAGATTPAGCTTTGTKIFTCSLCGDTKRETIPAVGHSYANGTCTVCGDAEVTGLTLYYDNSSTGWGTVYIYTWNDDGYSVEWPGTAMTNEGNGIWSYTVAPGTPNVIFNNGSGGTGNQTADLTVPGHNYIYNGSAWSPVGSVCTHPTHDTDGICSECGQAVNHNFVGGTCTVCGATESVSDSLYFVFGYIDGADYNGYDYPFVGGKVTVHFEQDSYIFVCDTNGIEYMTEGWVGEVTSAVMAPVATLSNPNKLMVPGGVDVTLSLTVNPNGTITVGYGNGGGEDPECSHSYTSAVTTPATCTGTGVKTFTCSKCGDTYTETIPTSGHSYMGGSCTVCGETEEEIPLVAYYLFGYINGADYNDFDYAFINGSLTVRFEQDSYIFICDGGGMEYMTEGWVGEVTSTVMAPVHTLSAPNKLLIPGGVTVTITLVPNSDGTLTVSYANAAECSHSYTSVVTPATPEATGFTTHTCTLCGNRYTDSTTVFTPAISGFQSTADGIRINWNAVAGAGKYRVFAKTSKGWLKLGDTTGTSFVWTGAKAGLTYTFTIRALNADGTAFVSAYNTTGWKHTHTLTAPTISRFDNVANGIKITWNALNGAEKYRVFAKTSKGWLKLGDTAGTSFLWTGAKSGLTYTFTVRALNAAGTAFTSAYNTTGWKQTYVAQPNISKMESTTSGIKLTWNAVNGAGKYRVFAKTSKGWLKLADVTGTSYVWNGAKLGLTYTFTVRALNAAGTAFVSSYNAAGVKHTYKPTPAITGFKCGSNGITINWSAINGAAKYRVFAKTSKGWVAVGTVSGTSFTWTAARPGYTYIFTVRCINAAGTAYTSPFNPTGWSVKYN